MRSCRVRLLILALISFAASVPAATEAPPGQGLDLLVIVDRSGSMRDRHAAALMLHVALDIVARNGEAMGLRHRFGVIGFGSAAIVDMPFTVVAADALPRLHRRIDGIPSRSLGDTDVLAAFTAAAAMFRAFPVDPARRRAIVVLTDGVPFVRGANMDEYGRQLQRFAAAHSGRGDPTVDVLLLAAADTRYAAMWRALSFDRVHTVARDRAALLAAAHRVVTRLVGTPSAEAMPSKTDDQVELLVVPPYLDVVVLDVFRSSPATAVDIFPPGALRPLRGGTDGIENVELGDVLSTLVVHRPVPGSWIVRKASAEARVRILSQQFFPRGVLVRPAITDELRQYDRVRVAYSVVDTNGRLIDELPAYKLALDLTLAKPDGTAEPVAMERRPELAGTVFAAVHESECALPGRYWTNVGVTSVDAEGNRVDVFRDRWSGFSVTPATRIDCRVTAAPQRWTGGVAMHAECFDADRQPIEMGVFASGAPSALFRPQLLHGNAPVGAALDLRYLGGGVFRGVLHGAERAGAYRLQLTVDRTRVRPPYNVCVVPGAVVFVRSAIDLRWLVPLLLVAVVVVIIAVVKQSRRRRVVSGE